MDSALLKPPVLANLDDYYDRFCELRVQLGVRGAWEQVEREYEAVHLGQHRYDEHRYESFVKMYKRRDKRERRKRSGLIVR